MCDDDTTNGDEKVSSGDSQLFMQYFNRSSLVTCGCWCDDVMVPGMLGGASRVAGSPSGRGLGSLQLLQRQSHSWQSCCRPSSTLTQIVRVVAQIPISATIDTWRKQAPPPFLLYFSFLTHSFTFRQSVSLTLKLERQRTLWQG